MPLKIPVLNIVVHWINSSNITGFLHKHSLPAIIYENHKTDLNSSQRSINFMQPLNYKAAAAAAAATLIGIMLSLFSRDINSWHVRGEGKRHGQLSCLFQFNRAE